MPNDPIIGTVEKGRFIPSNFLAMYRLEGKQCILDAVKKKRTFPLNRYYWGVVIKMISDFIGEEPETTHDLMRSMFLYINKQIKDKLVKLLLSTAKLTTDKFMEYCSKIKMWASQFLNLYIPDPNEVNFDY